MDWGREFAALCAWYHWTPDVPPGLTFPQWWNYWLEMQTAKREAMEDQARMFGAQIERRVPGAAATPAPATATDTENLDARLAAAKGRLAARTGRAVFGLNELVAEAYNGNR